MRGAGGKETRSWVTRRIIWIQIRASCNAPSWARRSHEGIAAVRWFWVIWTEYDRHTDPRSTLSVRARIAVSLIASSRIAGLMHAFTSRRVAAVARAVVPV